MPPARMREHPPFRLGIAFEMRGNRGTSLDGGNDDEGLYRRLRLRCGSLPSGRFTTIELALPVSRLPAYDRDGSRQHDGISRGNSGHTASRGFCQSCGSFIMAKSSGYPGAVWFLGSRFVKGSRARWGSQG